MRTYRRQIRLKPSLLDDFLGCEDSHGNYVTNIYRADKNKIYSKPRGAFSDVESYYAHLAEIEDKEHIVCWANYAHRRIEFNIYTKDNMDENVYLCKAKAFCIKTNEKGKTLLVRVDEGFNLSDLYKMIISQAIKQINKDFKLELTAIDYFDLEKI